MWRLEGNEKGNTHTHTHTGRVKEQRLFLERALRAREQGGNEVSVMDMVHFLSEH